MTKVTWDEIVSNPEKTFDEKMLPLMKQDIEADFHDTVREGKKMIIKLEKENFDELFNLPDSIDLNKIADNKIKITAIENKIKVIEELYKELFGVELK